MSVASQLNDRLHGASPFSGLDLLPADLQGWLGSGGTQVLDQLIDQTKPALILEIGTWKGRSALHMLGRARRWTDAAIICVDTWLGSAEHWINPEFKPMLALRNGRPRLYEQFMSNVVHAGLQDHVVPLPLPSLVAAEVLASMSCQVSFIYIDAGHDFKSVSDDIDAYWPMLSPGGVMVGDDYRDIWPGVKAAVDSFFERSANEMLTKGVAADKWYVQRRPA